MPDPKQDPVYQCGDGTWSYSDDGHVVGGFSCESVARAAFYHARHPDQAKPRSAA
jgi:hypothetical protein